ncbi:MAG: hypothetical protein EXQ77_06040 [Thermoleophilia bacterium]|nr:hypothetical protein [Thermoleophilia bacterium]
MKLSRRDLLQLAALAAAGLGASLLAPRMIRRSRRVGKTVGQTERIPSMCQMCSTACGIVATVKEGRLLTVAGNPKDPNSQGSLCAKGVAGPSILYDPHRVLYPLRRVGKRGEGKWKRVSWDEAYAEMAQKLGAVRASGKPERFAFQQGRNRSSDIVSRFLNAFGTPTHFTHRALCSLNRRAAILATIGDSDWDLGDFENSRYVLNFGCNWAEAHQGHIPVAIRMMRARERGAKLVTFDARLSNTAALSDEWFPVKPGTDGAIAMALAHVICQEGLVDRAFWDRWANVPLDDYRRHLAPFTPEFAERESGVPAATLRRVAREFAAAAPRSTTISNRGSHAHWNGFYNDRAIVTLNALIGSMGKPGGWCWHPSSAWDTKRLPEPAPVPPRPKVRSVIADAAPWPLANAWKGKGMKVGTIVYLWLKERRQEIDVLFTYNTDQAWSWPEMGLVREVLLDETLVPFHVVLDVMMSETADLADLVLPWTTYLERWDIDARPPQGLIDYVGLRQPVVSPLGESKDLREIFPELARRIGGGMEGFFPWRSTEAYLEAYFAPVPGGFAAMRRDGMWMDPAKKPNYLPFERALTAVELDGSRVDEHTSIVYKGEDPETHAPVAVGIVVEGVARRGFATPSRKLEISSSFAAEKGAKVGRTVLPLPTYLPIPDHARPLDADELVMVSFKWNVHNAHRTMQSKWLQEIVHSNPAWMNTRTAARLGLRDGDWVEVTSYRPNDPLVPRGDGSPVGRLRTRVHVTEGVHPEVLAISHNAGRTRGGPIASRSTEPVPGTKPAPSASEVGATPEATEPASWHATLSVAQNNLMPIYPDPTSGQQAYNDTRVRVRKL